MACLAAILQALLHSTKKGRVAMESTAFVLRIESSCKKDKNTEGMQDRSTFTHNSFPDPISNVNKGVKH